MTTVVPLLENVARFYMFMGRLLGVAIGWWILWALVQLLVLLAWSL